MVDLSVDPQSGQVTLGRVVVAHDCGLIINPDGLKNQIEGNVIQSASRAMLEQVNFDTSKITSVDWRTYPIFRFDAVPKIDVVLVDHPDQPAWGAAAAGCAMCRWRAHGCCRCWRRQAEVCARAAQHLTKYGDPVTPSHLPWRQRWQWPAPESCQTKPNRRVDRSSVSAEQRENL